MPTTNSGTLTEHWQFVRLRNDGSCEVDLQYTNTASGQERGSRILKIPSSASLPILDQDGNTVVAGNGWATLASAISTFVTQLGTSETNAAGAGKLDL
jgi:hypothetical protein